MLGMVIGVTLAAGMGGTGAGGLCACCFRRDSGRTVSLLLSFAAGVMTAVVCFDLLHDAMGDGGWRQLALVAAGVLLGYAVIDGLNAWLERGQARSRRERSGLFLAGVVMAAAIALHNVPEGMVIGASFAGGEARAVRGGLVMAAVIGLHNVLEGMAVTVPLISGGMGKVRAVGIAAATGLPTVAGAALGYFMGTMGPLALSLALSFASGAMLYVVYGELLPEAMELWRSRAPALAAVAGVLTGMCIIYL